VKSLYTSHEPRISVEAAGRREETKSVGIQKWVKNPGFLEEGKIE
jgi:hypothetical protein